MIWRLSIALLAATSTFASAAAEVRIIVEKNDPTPGANAGKMTQHDNDTPYVEPGGTITLDRSSDNFVWVYEHLINLTPTEFSDDDASVTGREFTSSNGTLANVILPLFTIGSQVTSGQAGNKAFLVNVRRSGQVGDIVNITLSKRSGTIRFKGRIGCSATSSGETLSKLTALTASADAIGAGRQGSFTFKLDLPPPCQKQRIQIAMPPCFQTSLPGSTSRSGSVAAVLEPSDPKQITLRLYAAASGTCEGNGGDIKVTTNGATRIVPVRYFDTARFTKPKPLVPQLPDRLKPRKPGGTVTPKPKPIPGG